MTDISLSLGLETATQETVMRRATCEGCGAVYKIPDSVTASRVRCKKCQGVVSVSALEPAEAGLGEIEATPAPSHTSGSPPQYGVARRRPTGPTLYNSVTSSPLSRGLWVGSDRHRCRRVHRSSYHRRRLGGLRDSAFDLGGRAFLFWIVARGYGRNIAGGARWC